MFASLQRQFNGTSSAGADHDELSGRGGRERKMSSRGCPTCEQVAVLSMIVNSLPCVQSSGVGAASKDFGAEM